MVQVRLANHEIKSVPYSKKKAMPPTPFSTEDFSEFQASGTNGQLMVRSSAESATTTSIIQIDAANNRVGINKLAPNTELDVSGDLAVSGGIGVGAPAAYGNSGDVLTSQGAGVAPIWNAPTSSSVLAYEQWYLTSNATTTGNITSWARQTSVTNTCMGQVVDGAGMTVTGLGRFAFPSTGKWRVGIKIILRSDLNYTGSREIRINGTNSAWASSGIMSRIWLGRVGNGGAVGENVYLTGSGEVLVDISNTSNDQVAFYYSVGGTASSANLVLSGISYTMAFFEKMSS